MADSLIASRQDEQGYHSQPLSPEGMTGEKAEGLVVSCLEATTASPYLSSLITSVSPILMMADSWHDLSNRRDHVPKLSS